MRKSVHFDTNLNADLVSREEKQFKEFTDCLEMTTHEKIKKTSILKSKLSVYPQIDFPIENNNYSHKDTRRIYINQSKKNIKKYKYEDNFIKTSRYTFFNFIPMSLFYQFKRHANIYFLFCAIIQCFPAISPLNPMTAIAPFVLVLTISMVREGIEDYYKHMNDEKENVERVLTFKDKDYKEELSRNLQVGDIIKVDEYSLIPADILMLSCSNLNKMAYIETANLDGEKNLKPKFCVGTIFNIFKDANNFVRIRGKIVCDKPNSDLNFFNGRIKLTSNIDVAVSVKQLLFKGNFT